MGGLLAKILTELLDILRIAVVVCSRELIWDFFSLIRDMVVRGS